MRRFSFERAMRNKEYRAMTGLVIASLLLVAKMWSGAGASALSLDGAPDPSHNQDVWCAVKTVLYGRLAQLVEHRSYTPVVTGSSPVPPTKNEQ